MSPTVFTLAADDRVVRLLAGQKVVAEHRRSGGLRPKLESPDHRAEIVARKRGASASTARDRLRMAAPGIDVLLQRWVEAGRNVGSMVAQTSKLLDLYGLDVFRRAVADTIERGTHDPGEIGVLCEKRRCRWTCASATTCRTATSSRTTWVGTMPSDDVLRRLQGLGFRLPLDALSDFAARERLSPLAMAERLVELKRREREARNLTARTRLAMLGKFQTLERFDRNHPRKIDRALYERLYKTLDFVDRAENVLLRGPSGVGKTTLAQNLGLSALTHG